MVVTTIISFTASVQADSIISKLSKALNTLKSQARFTIGTRVQEPTTIQITAEWPSFQARSLTVNPEFQAFLQTISETTCSHLETTVVTLNNPICAAGSPSLIEFVYSSFPSTSPPGFQAKIEDDFARFETLYRRRGSPKDCGEIGLAKGWAEEKDGVRAFVVVRGWSEMQRFEEAVQSEEFEEGIPILMGWGAPFELWHVERKAGSEGL